MTHLGPRIAPPSFDSLTDGQKRLYENTVRVLGAPVGPRMVLLNHAQLAEKWAALADVIKTASYSQRLRELVVLTIARYWGADFEWYAHEKLALAAGLPASVIDAIRQGVRPHFDDPADAAVHAYCSAIQERHAVTDAVYDELRDLLGTSGMIELTALIGHYTSVSITLVAHRIALPEGQASPFQALA
jgi:4-carboxymuconolactone decarboxylase